jgi:hypothetical protein
VAAVSEKTADDEFNAQTLEDAARWELVLLWEDLDRARRSAIRDAWSIACDGLVERITMFTRLVGPTPWEKIQIPLLEDGVYQEIHAKMGVQVDVDMERVAVTRARINAHSDIHHPDYRAKWKP